MKRLVLGALALMLTSGALVVQPVYACVVEPLCDDEACYSSCRARGYSQGICNWCTGRCVCS